MDNQNYVVNDVPNEQASLEGLYKKALAEMEEAVTESDYMRVATRFYGLRGYKDSEALESRCRLRIEKLKNDAEKEIKTRFFEVERQIERNRREAQQMLDSARASSDFIFAQLEKAKKAETEKRLSEELDEARRAVRRAIRAPFLRRAEA